MLRPAVVGVLLLVIPDTEPLAGSVDVYAAGDIADCRRGPPAESDAARTARLVPKGSMVFVLGDAAYQYATAATLGSCYEPTWGRHRDRTWAVPGNHDYVEGRAVDFHAYFGSGAGPDGYFARRLGDWLVIGLDSEQRVSGLDRQYRWLERTLAGNADAPCTIAMWHAPLFSSGFHRGSGRHMQRFWELLDAHRTDVVLNGHEHFYESFDPLDASGRPVAEGIREFVVGTGGAWLHGFWMPPYRSRSRIERHGVLKLTLGEGTYAWQFIDVRGHARDQGTAACRQRAPSAGRDSAAVGFPSDVGHHAAPHAPDP
jgi:3',5'-cyclic AMP phosphodiesterase CpdA